MGAGLAVALVPWAKPTGSRVTAVSPAVVPASTPAHPVASARGESDPAAVDRRAGALGGDRVAPTVGPRVLAEAPPVGEVPDPGSLVVLVDHQRHLPPGWEPPNLVEPDVAFVFDGPSPKRLLRVEAARAFEELVAAARLDGVEVVGVSGYRSEQTQRDLFARYAAERGEAEASRISARPGHSEHQTGLAIDVTGADRTCQASGCFAGTREARWLAGQAHRFGWIVRYPPGAEEITGFQPEPWHLRYVGRQVAAELHRSGATLDEHLGAR